MTLNEKRREFLIDWHPAPGHATISVAWETSLDALIADVRREALEEAAKLVLEQAMQWDAPDADDPGCERTVLLNARNAIRARGGV